MSDFTRKLLILSCLLFTSFCFWKAASGLVGGGDASVLPSAQAAILPSVTPPRVVTTPIQEMRPGMRIVGRNPLRVQTESTVDPTPDGWRLLSVRMLKADGTYFEAELLRPLSWIRRHRAQPGATIQLNMPEMYVVGAAEVLAISDCPPIDPGEGPVVLSTFKNVSDNVLNIYVEGEATPIGVTAGHPIWSEDRQAFVHSEKLQIGERLRSAFGKTVRITSIEIRAGPEPVYNLEVAGEHVYSVTDSGLLVHNTGPCDLGAPSVNDEYLTFYHGTSKANASSVRKGIDPKYFNAQNDFGAGFYLSSSRNVAHTRAKQLFGDSVEVLEYRILRSDYDNLRQLNFDGPTSAWQDFVRFNRIYEPPLLSGGNPVDVISGPMWKKLSPSKFGSDGRTVASWPWPSEPQISIHTDRAIQLFNEGLVK